MKKVFKIIVLTLVGIVGIGAFFSMTTNASANENNLLVKSKQVIDFPINTLSEEVQELYIENGWGISKRRNYYCN